MKQKFSITIDAELRGRMDAHLEVQGFSNLGKYIEASIRLMLSLPVEVQFQLMAPSIDHRQVLVDGLVRDEVLKKVGEAGTEELLRYLGQAKSNKGRQ
jgi:hypothetical protein